MKTTRIAALAAVAVIGSGLALHAWAQLPGVTRADVLKHDLSVPGREVVQVRVGIGPGVTAAKHNHPGEEIAYVLEGVLEYRLDGRPPVIVKTGEALFIPAGTPHAVTNVGSVPAIELATYIVEKGKPLVAVVD